MGQARGRAGCAAQLVPRPADCAGSGRASANTARNVAVSTVRRSHVGIDRAGIIAVVRVPISSGIASVARRDIGGVARQTGRVSAEQTLVEGGTLCVACWTGVHADSAKQEGLVSTRSRA